MSDWTEMDLRELHESGLLWHVNRAVFWPLGLALTVEKKDGEYVRLFVQAVQPCEPIASGDSGAEEAHRAEVLGHWMRGRLA